MAVVVVAAAAGTAILVVNQATLQGIVSKLVQINENRIISSL
ncbi:hypothetical protein [Salmonella sp. s51933]